MKTTRKGKNILEELFEKAPIKQVYFKISLPVVMGMLASMVYNLADTFFVAQTGNTDLVAGITVCTPLFMFMLALGDIFGIGGSSVISRLFGQKEHDRSARTSSACFYYSIGLGIVVTVLLLIFEKPLLHMLGATAATYRYAAAFYRVYVLGAPIIITSLTPTNLIRTEGLAKQSMLATVYGIIVSLILDPIFIFGLKWGAAGVALSNLLGYALELVLLIYYTVRDCKYINVDIKRAHINWKEFREVLAIGIPGSITNLMQSFGIALLNNFLAAYGADQVAAMGITQKIASIITLVMVGFAFGAQPLIGYNYGAKNVKRFKEALDFDLLIEVGYAIIFSIILMIIAPFLIKIFMNKPIIVSLGAYMLRACLTTTPFIGAILVFTTVFQSAGKAWSAFTMSFARQGVVYLITMLACSAFFGFHGVVWAQPVADVITFAIGLLLYRGDFHKWMQQNEK